ncbi:MAG: ferredoxin [Candidatus Omnitrophica bacterium]|nr:ferredoxin [Candidatus Omnitrophota bacterium]
MKALVDKNLCIGCQLCAQIDPDIFEMQDDIAVTKVDKVPSAKKEKYLDAAKSCPVDAIAITEK